MLIELEELTKTYGAITALAGLSTALPEGAVGLLGPNGAGKTTMIRSLLGLIAIDAGRGRVLGMDIAREALEIRQTVGFVPEDECLFPGVTGVQFVAYAGELVGMGPRDALQRAHEVLDYVDLGEARYRRAESYSTGMKQRLKIASAIVHDPRLLILDEPTNGMDPVGRDEILALCRDLSRAKGMNLLISSHLLPDVEAVCEYVVVLGKGRVLAQGRIAELKQAHDRQFELRVRGDQRRFAGLLGARGVRAEPVNDHLLVDLPPGSTVAALWETAEQAAEQIRSLRPRRSTLEEVFLRALGEPS
ncbi:ABC transporter ATP-binding protein [Paludisphaera borealis]|uniref:Putative ABC transporter ATP-binding protein YxlF n=1 Tax=Paludisphaera borealis TaxID=1387353 RepID=A0A1U7CR21_9BACT|nr:ABC transporter ATP-binding protein [Paludisphaera borealis]APW61346.1 putative ABC transporter ATP-binding protein YxlF [Paludisphaera borealis]